MDNEVLIVGAGPTGLTLAIDLGRRGVRCTIIEQKAQPAFLPKMERINARSMEIYRRMGLAEKIRAAGLRADCPMNVYIILALTEPPLLTLPYPSVNEARAKARATNDGTLPLEPYQLISQYTLEPLLKSIAETMPTVTVRFGCEFLSLRQDDNGVAAEVRTADGKTENIRSTYLVGCDGGASPVRKELDIALSGEGNLLGLRQALFRCDELFDRLPIGNGPKMGPGHGRHYHVADDKATFLIMQDSTKHWTLHSVVDSDDEMKAAFERTVNVPVKYEMLSCAPWRQNLLLADRYGHGRVFIAGDAAHLVIPTGGLGMNSGVGDATDLSWKLAATLQGWGGPNLLASYEVDRRQVGDRNVGASRYATIGRRKWRSLWRPNIREDSPAGAETRQKLSAVADVEQRKSNEMIGAELGYRYVDSPIICNIPGGPEHLFREYQPTTWPGARLPHVWLDDGTPLQDRVPDGYSILKLGGSKADVGALENAIRARGAPVAVLDIPDRVARDVYGYDLILLRPDMHIVWRGNEAPEDAVWVAAKVTGWGS
ncbi:MAG TPA: FAD-dependent monooxygenase [Xanthobacteraceae bacterium]|jgi:2-polyprenyl-6-methoxyphenol hydroxylase-like FAD-dependent oxidoreductase|nr:FAD-dependent monooxygenase [Xanthobacteraceae bacterium]